MALLTLSITFSVLFLVLLFVLHFLKRELDPSWRMISEYEIGRFGWLMRLAFFCWGASVLTLLIALWPSLLPISGTIARVWLIVIVFALFGAGIFKTDPITALTKSLTNRLHTICGAIVILTFPIAATLVVRSLLHNPAWAAYSGLLILATVLIWVGVVAYFGSITIARMKDPLAGTEGHAKVYQGWPNRISVALYIAWIILVASIALKIKG